MFTILFCMFKIYKEKNSENSEEKGKNIEK